jgi:hypothetical protein
MFGKRFSEYIRFELWILILIAVVFVVRLVLPMAGVPIAQARWVSINLVLLVGLVYCSIAVHTARFGSYKQLFGLLLIQNVLGHFLIVVALAAAVITGTDNIYTSPEFFGGSSGRNWGHVLAHVVAGFVISVIAWLVGSAILFVTKKIAPRSGN